MFLPKVSFFSTRTDRSLLKVLAVVCILLLPGLMYAQNHARLQTRETSRKGKYYSRQTATVSEQKSYWVAPDFTFTSLSLRINPSQDFTGAYVVSEKDTFFLQQDEHQPEGDSLRQANLVILEKPSHRILFYPGNIKGDIIFSFMNAATGKREEMMPAKQLRRQQQKQEKEKGSCSEPDFIEQSVWRAGLPAPHYNRIATSVQHVIVHHAAGSNTNTDYVNVVRNIYLFHTQDRGWSDIGYNYLIAQDGTIFEGRSTGGQQVAHDNIQGAHFCGKNSETMGICLLGNYNTAVPTESSLTSLIKLTAWKLHKEGLNPLGQIPHAANATLGVIAGHRNGCATECPGDHLYARLDEIRLKVKERMEEACQEPLAFEVYPVPSDGLLYVSIPDPSYQLFLYDTRGQAITVPIYQEEGYWTLDTRLLVDGVYIVTVTGENFREARKVILLHRS